jgi:LysM repeat protein
MNSIFQVILLSLTLSFGGKKKDPASVYINTYSDIAVQEMRRSGIPASIKLAQALIESECGKSPLAQQGNNHFGIKCGSYWTGDTYFKLDDDTDSTGTIIESCFRVYSKPEESFAAHTEFLKDPKKFKRYGFLFSYSSSDYEAWAQGLKEAGYATDPTYPTKLISVIEKYGLHKYDEVIETIDNTEAIASNNSGTSKPNLSSDMSSRIKENKSYDVVLDRKKIYKPNKINDLKCIVITESITTEKLATLLSNNAGELMAYNEFIKTPSQQMTKGNIVYVEKKKKDYEGSKDYHKVENGQTIEEISNLYGVRASTLYSLNRIPKSCQPLANEKISLKERVKDKPKYARKKNDTQDEFLF